MLTPPILREGNTVAITAPGRKPTPQDVEFACQVLQSWGLNVVLPENIFSARHSYLAGSDEQRCKDLQSLIDDKTVKAIFSARGGYGTTRIVDRLDFDPLKKDPKWIIGFSDITALHLRLFTLGVASIHATMPVLFSKKESASSVESLRQILFYGGSKVDAPYWPSNRLGQSEGLVIGGNLSLIADSLGTSSAPDTAGKILVIEEIDEYYYKIDRMLTQLDRAGKLSDLAGLVVGYTTNILDSEVGFGESVEKIVRYKVRHYNYPVAFGFPIGHENPNVAWLHGGYATLSVTPQGSSFLQPKSNT